MKKTVVFVFLSLTMMGCNNQIEKIKSGYNSCDRTIVIDQAKINENWEIANRTYYSSTQPRNPNDCIHKKIYIDATEIEKRGIKVFADWLKANGSYICYKETSSYIECEHIITDSSDIEAIKKTSTHSSLTFNEIKRKITDLGGDFESYKHYMKISFGFFTKTKISLVDTYDPNANYYSLPLIKSIIDNNKLGENTKFIFKKVDLYNEGKIIFGVEISPGEYNYYNFSHIPPFLGENVTSPI